MAKAKQRLFCVLVRTRGLIEHASSHEFMIIIISTIIINLKVVQVRFLVLAATCANWAAVEQVVQVHPATAFAANTVGTLSVQSLDQ